MKSQANPDRMSKEQWESLSIDVQIAILEGRIDALAAPRSGVLEIFANRRYLWRLAALIARGVIDDAIVVWWKSVADIYRGVERAKKCGSLQRWRDSLIRKRERAALERLGESYKPTLENP